MQYFIDGYNLLFKLPHKKDSLEKKRLQLIAELNELSSVLNLNLTLVFDGSMPKPEKATRSHFHLIEIIYTPKEQTADAYIISAVELSSRPKEITVITSDNSLASQCRAQGAHAQSIHDFIEYLRKKKRKAEKRVGNAVSQERCTHAQLDLYLSIFEERFKNLNLRNL